MIADIETSFEPRTKKWTREDYYRLAEGGYFNGQRVQLIDGDIIQMPPQGARHVRAISAIQKWLVETLGPSYWVRVQFPLNVGRDSEPEPDISVVKGSFKDYPIHPESAELVIEVSDSSLDLDTEKAGLYAGAGIVEYWIVNIPERKVTIQRGPIADSTAAFGFSYRSSEDRLINEWISSLLKPEARLQVSELFI